MLSLKSVWSFYLVLKERIVTLIQDFFNSPQISKQTDKHKNDTIIKKNNPSHEQNQNANLKNGM